MTPVTTFAGRRVALFGLGGSGLATALALAAGGAEVVAFDDSAASLDKARAQGIATADLRAAEWSGFAALVLAPGVPLTHPEPHWTVKLAQAAGIEVIGDIELFCRERAKTAPNAPFVAITGTNGKSTTTALVAHILREAGLDVQMGGNIGTAILSLEPPANERVHVVEMSSFQIDLTPSLGPSPSRDPHTAVGAEGGLRSTHGRRASFEADLRSAPQDEEVGRFRPGSRDEDLGLTRPGLLAVGAEAPRAVGPTVGLVLNVTPDHLDRHGTMANYAAIKARLAAAAGIAIVGIDDEPGRALYERLSERGGRLLAITAGMLPGDGYHFEGTRVFATAGTSTHRVAELKDIASLRGSHNAQNAAAALGVAASLGLAESVVVRALATFPGLHHRMEEVGRLGETIFVNDSKATNADSAEKALLSFDRVHWIIGGKAKTGGIEALRPLFTKVAKAYLIGAATEAFAVTLDGHVPYARCGTLDRAVTEAAADAAASGGRDPVVLLSPACASYDQYPNFERRGDHFRDLVRALPGAEMRA